MSRKISRRSFLQVTGISLAFIGVGGGIKIKDQAKEFIRPPGAINEDDFLAKCIKCQKCLQACPVDLIRPIALTESIMDMGTPRLDFKIGYCDFCLACVTLCPTGAILPLKEKKIKLGTAKIRKESCIAWSWGGCTNCYLSCPNQAITIDEHSRPIIDEDKCDGCGKCEYICPSASMRSYNTQELGKGIVVQKTV